MDREKTPENNENAINEMESKMLESQSPEVDGRKRTSPTTKVS